MSSQMGRPRLDNPKTIRFSVCLDCKLQQRLQEYCDKNNIKKGEAVRKGIELLLEQK